MIYINLFFYKGTRELNDAEGAVEIRKMQCPPLLAETIFVEWLQEGAFSENQVDEITYMLSAHYNNKIIVTGQKLIFSYFGLKPTLKVG